MQSMNCKSIVQISRIFLLVHFSILHLFIKCKLVKVIDTMSSSHTSQRSLSWQNFDHYVIFFNRINYRWSARYFYFPFYINGRERSEINEKAYDKYKNILKFKFIATTFSQKEIGWSIRRCSRVLLYFPV